MAAADLDEIIYAKELPVTQPVEVGSGWYLRGDLGYSIRTRGAATSYSVFTAGPPAAYAGEVQGVVQSVDTENRIITLEDGTQITADAAVDLEALASGDKVTITIDDTTTSAVNVQPQM